MLVLLICPRRFPIDIMGYYPLLKEAGERTSLLMLLVKVLCELKRALTKGFWRFFPLLSTMPTTLLNLSGVCFRMIYLS